MKRSAAIASARIGTKESRFNTIVEILDLKHKGDWRIWEDAESNILKISKNGAVQVYPSKISITTRDIFKKAEPKLIAKHSYWVLCLFGTTQKILVFLGNDGILRCCLFDNNQWIENLSSVLLGFKTLKVIASGYIDSEPRRMPQMNITYPKSFEIEEAWASGYPSNDSQLQEKIQCLGIS